MTTPPDELIVTFRDTMWRSVPPWLKIGTAQKYLYALAVQLDAAGDALVAGVKMRFPNLYSGDSLATIGAERRIRRGLEESNQNYAGRLTRWLEDHRVRGGAYALLNQLYVHYAPNNFPIVLSYPSGTRYFLDVTGNITWSRIENPPPIPNWARWSLLYFTDDIDASDVEDLILIPRDWIAAHCFGEIILMTAGTELWDYPPTALWDEAGAWNSLDAPFRVQVR